MKKNLRLNCEKGIMMIKLIIIIIMVIVIIAGTIIILLKDKKNTNNVDTISNYNEQQDSIDNSLMNNVDSISNSIEQQDNIDNSLMNEEVNTETDLGSEEFNLPRISNETLEVFKKRIDAICYQYEDIEGVPGFNNSSITLFPDNTCKLGFYQIPYAYDGTYLIKGKDIICNINSLSTEHGVNQDINNFNIILKIIDDNSIKVESVSVNSITARLVDVETIMDETQTVDLSSIKNDDIVYTNYIKSFKKTFEKYLKLSEYENSRIGPMNGILIELGLSSRKELDKIIEASGLDYADTKSYIKSNVKYDLFKERMLQYVTEKLFEEKYSQYKNIDGYVGFCNCAGGSDPLEYCSAILSSEISKNDYTFQVLMKDVILYDNYKAGDSYLKENDCYYIKFVKTKYENGKIKIDLDKNSTTN